MIIQKQISIPAGNRFIIVCWVFMISACAVKTENQPFSREDSLVQQAVSMNDEKLGKKNILEDPLPIAELLGKMDPAQHADFIKIKDEHTDKSNIYLRKATYEAFQRMYEAAVQEGIQLKIISATRNFADQKRIWENKWNGSTKVGGEDLSKTIADPAARALKILEYSSMPGTSRHHWGTDIDLNHLNNAWFASGEGKKVYEWLQTHADTYGFCQPYSEKGTVRPDGYNEEKWHWSYMPLAHPFLQKYSEKVTYEEMGGFAGAEVAAKIQVIDKYVKGIAPACRQWTD